MTEGICIPLVAKPDLIRNVTILGCGLGRSTCYVSIILYLQLLLGTMH